MDDLKELKYHSEYGLILLMGISKTSDFGRFFQMKETKDVSFTCTLIYKGKLFKVNQSEKTSFILDGWISTDLVPHSISR